MGMQVVTVIPIVRQAANRQLSYFTSSNVRAGALVLIPLQSKTVPAFVLAADEAEFSRQEIRSSNFQLRKMGKVISHQMFTELFMQALHSTSEETAIDVEQLLPALIPVSILENAASLPKLTVVKNNNSENTVNERCAFEGTLPERMFEFKSIVRGSFARDESVFLAVPTIAHGEFVTNEISRGIESRVIFLHSSLSKKEQAARIIRTLKSRKSVCIIATPMFLSMPRSDFGTIVIERELSQAYRQIARPHLDFRIALEHLAHKTHSKLLRADFPVGVETHWRVTNGELNIQKGDLNFSQVSSIIVFTDMRPKKVESDVRVAKRPGKKLQIIGPDLGAQIERTIQKNEKLFVFSPRRGRSPLTLCDDCGEVVTCKKCGSYAVLHSKQGKRLFICHHCGASRSARERCTSCSSWKLTDLGIGIEKSRETIAKGWPDASVFTIDRDSTATDTKAKAEWSRFRKAERGILIGTNLALPYLTSQIEHTAAVSIDTLLSLPEWNSAERTFSIILHLAQIAKQTCVIQTRRPDAKMLQYLKRGDETAWYADELHDRETLHYPPFTVLIKVTATSTPTRYLSDRNILRRLLQKWSPTIYEPSVQMPRRKTTCALLKIPRDLWPQQELSRALSSLPRHITVEINPDRII
jgi:primosomal protein N'